MQRLPRELAEGVFWLGECLVTPAFGRVVHAYNSVYLLCGSERSVIVEAGLPTDVPAIEAQIAALVEAGAPPPAYIFLSHTETPHAGGVGYFLDRYPEAIACGDVSDLHLVFPRYEDRLRPLEPGDSLDLGDSELVVVEAIFRDYASSRWAFDTRRRVLFAGDGFSYAHYHEEGQCGHLAEEVPLLDLPAMTALFAQAAFYWTRFVDIEPFVERLERLVYKDLAADLIAPTHGLPIADPETTLPLIVDGLRRGSDRFEAGEVESA